MKTAITLFTGGGLADVALMAAGYTVVAGVEYDADIAAVANKNLGGHVRVMDILDANSSDFPACDLLHASPPCPNFSVAKANGEETEHDIAMAEKVAEFVKVLKPRHFTLENVRGYKQSKSFKIICDALRDCGYRWRVVICNAADLGVPQTRIRLIVLASLDGMPKKPQPTHQKAKDEQQGLFESRLPNWIGWYEAIEDLIPSLPESRFADWQLARLPEEMATCISPVQGEGTGFFLSDEPYQTIVSNQGLDKYRAFIIGAGGFDGTVIQAEQSNPCFTVTANQNQQNQLRAFIVPGGNQSARAIQKQEPMFTVCDVNRGGNHARAWLDSGRVVSMTPRALARFQSIPDWYELPKSNALACRIIGNALPPLMYQRILEAL